MNYFSFFWHPLVKVSCLLDQKMSANSTVGVAGDFINDLDEASPPPKPYALSNQHMVMILGMFCMLSASFDLWPSLAHMTNKPHRNKLKRMFAGVAFLYVFEFFTLLGAFPLPSVRPRACQAYSTLHASRSPLSHPPPTTPRR